MSYSTKFRLLNRLLQDTQGSIIPVLAFGLVMLVTAVGVAIDLSREQTLHAKLNSAMDASTLAAAKSIEVAFPCDSGTNDQAAVNACIQNQVSTAGTTYFKTNYANAFGSVPVTPTFTYDYTSGNIIGSVNAEIPTTFMQVVGQKTFPVTANTLTLASVFYFGQGITTGSATQYLNPMTYNDPTTGLYSRATTSSTTPFGPYNGGTNSIVMSANGFDTLSIIPASALTYADENATNDIVIGNNSFDGGTTDYGPALHFGGISGSNTDDIFIQRHNVASDQSSLFVNVGDNYNVGYGPGLTGDAFFVGAQSTGHDFRPVFQVNSDGNAYLADTGYTGGAFPEIGAKLHFGSANLVKENLPATSDNTDDLLIERWNVASNQSALVVNLAGGDAGSAFTSADGGDAFIIGATGTGSNFTDYHALFTFSSDGKLLIGNTDTQDFTVAPTEGGAILTINNPANSWGMQITNGAGYGNLMLGDNGGTTNTLLAHETTGNFEIWNGYVFGNGGVNNLLFTIDPTGNSTAAGNVISGPNSYIQPGNAANSNGGTGVAINTGCTSDQKGAMAYSATDHVIVYCDDQTNVWTSISTAPTFSVRSESGNNAINGQVFVNSTGAPIFISSICPGTYNQGQWLEAVLAIAPPGGGFSNIAVNRVATGGSDAIFDVIPFVSGMVPAGYSWRFRLNQWENHFSGCTITVLANSAVEF